MGSITVEIAQKPWLPSASRPRRTWRRQAQMSGMASERIDGGARGLPPTNRGGRGAGRRDVVVIATHGRSASAA